MQAGVKKSRFSINISLYLTNNTRYNHSYHGMRIGNFTQAFEWYHFRWLWVTLGPDSQTVLSWDVYLSVCLSHAGILSKWLNITIESLWHHFRFCSNKRYGNILTGTLNGGIECKVKGVWKNRDFRSISRYISEMIQDTAMITTECE